MPTDSPPTADQLLRAAPDAIIVADAALRIQIFNAAAEQLFGYAAAEALGQPLARLLPFASRAAHGAQLQALTAGPAVSRTMADRRAVVGRHQSGREIPVEVSIATRRADDQIWFTAIVRDVGDRLRLESELRERAAYLRALLDNSPFLLWLKDAEGRFLAVNDVFARACGQTSPDALIGQTDLDVWPRELAERYRADDFEVMQLKQQKSIEEPIAEQGVTRWFETFKTPILDEAGRVLGTTGFSRDITARKQTEDHLHQSEALYHTLVETLPMNIFRKDAAGRFTFGNTLYCRTQGLTPADFLGKTDFDIHPLELAQKYRADDERVMASGQTFETVEEHQTLNGPLTVVQTLKTPLYDAAGRVNGLQGIFWDITARTHTEEQLRASEAQNRAILNALPDRLFRVARDGTPLDFKGAQTNEQVTRTVTEALPPAHSVAHATFMTHIAQALDTGQIQVFEYQIAINGQRLDFEARIVASGPAEVLTIVRSITERKFAERQTAIQYDLALNLATAASLDAALPVCLRAALRASDMDCGGIYLIDRRTGDLDLRCAEGLSPEFVRQTSHIATESDRGRLVRQGQPIYIRYDQIDVPRSREQQQEGLRGMAIIPVLHQGRLVACFNLASHTLAEVPTRHRDTLHTVAAYVGNGVARLQAEERLRENEAELQALFDSLQDFLFVLDEQGHILRVNQVVLHRLNYQTTDLLGQPVLMIHPPERRAEAQRIITAMLAGTAAMCPVPLLTSNGRQIPVETKVWPGRWGDRAVLFGISRDVTERQQAEQAITQLNEALEQRVIERTTQLAATNLDLEREIVERRRSDAALHYRLDLEKLISTISTNFINLALPEIDGGLDRALQAIGSFANVDRSYIFQFTADSLAMDNTHEWCTADIEPQIANLQGVPSAAVPWWMAQLQRFQTVYIPRVADLPPAASAERNLLEAQNILSVIVVPLVHGGSLVGFLGFDAVRQTKSWAEEDIRLLNIVGESIANTLARQRTDRALQQERALLTQRVAERTAELSAANAELARAARLKDEFLANMSHELRTPLNAILGLSETLQDAVYGPINDKQDKALRNIEESGRHLLALINDVLDLSKIGAGKVELNIEPALVDDVCQAALRLIKETAHQKRLHVAALIDSHVVVVNADLRRLKQILVNLLSNAVKFTPAGGQIGLEVQGDPAQETVRFTIWDTGIGIAAENLPLLFKSFMQIDSRLSRQYEGTGLGLTLVARLVEMHGGSVSVESQLGRGSRFTVMLPWQEVEVGGWKPVLREAEGLDAARGAPQPIPAAVPPLILVAEDNEMNLQALVDYLTAIEFRVTVARNGVEAIQRAQEDPPAAIIMDIQMPIMDGLEAIGHIRAIPALARVPIIALTALAMPGDRERCLAAGATDYLSKPVRLKQLVKTIEAQLAREI